MSSSKGTTRQPTASAFLVARERHLTELRAWRRVRAAQRELDRALADYGSDWDDGHVWTASEPAAVNGFTELAASQPEAVQPAEAEGDEEMFELPSGPERPKKKREKKKAAPEAISEEPRDSHAPPSGDWREQKISIVTDLSGDLSAEIAKILDGADFETIGDIAIALRNGSELEDLFESESDALDLAEGLRFGFMHYIRWMRWAPDVEYPAGIPLSWITAKTVDPTEPAEPEPDPALGRLGQMLDRTLSDRQPGADSLPPWTSEDLEVELTHALTTPQPDAARSRMFRSPMCGPMLQNGATNLDIHAEINVIWPSHVVTFIPPDETGGKLGYTVASGPVPRFFLGNYHGYRQKPTLEGSALLERIRTVLEIPTPTEARKRAQASFTEPDQAAPKRGRGRPRKAVGSA